ncbi:MAG: hypothetical protein ACE5FT_00205 [Candidatus Nanoarchaeia archaeon]
MITDFIKQFTTEEVIDIEHVIKIDRRFYLADPKDDILIQKSDPTYTGTYLGEEVKKKFKPSFILLDLIGKHTDKKVRVNDKAAWLFICGRDILDSKANFPDRTIVLVTSENDEVLGYGIFWEGKISVKNILDRGDFLRKER